MSDIKLYVDYKDLSWIITIERYSSFDWDDFDIAGYIELDGKENEIVDITEADKELLKEMHENNESLFDRVCYIYTDKVDQAISQNRFSEKDYYID